MVYVDYDSLFFFLAIGRLCCFRKLPKSYTVYRSAAEHEIPHFGCRCQNYLKQVLSLLRFRTIAMAEQVCWGLSFL